jgi:hypothetical protein
MNISRKRFQVVELLFAAQVAGANHRLDLVRDKEFFKFIWNALNPVWYMHITNNKNQHSKVLKRALLLLFAKMRHGSNF